MQAESEFKQAQVPCTTVMVEFKYILLHKYSTYLAASTQILGFRDWRSEVIPYQWLLSLKSRQIAIHYLFLLHQHQRAMEESHEWKEVSTEWVPNRALVTKTQP